MNEVSDYFVGDGGERGKLRVKLDVGAVNKGKLHRQAYGYRLESAEKSVRYAIIPGIQRTARSIKREVKRVPRRSCLVSKVK